MAAGLTLRAADLPVFTAAFDAEVRRMAAKGYALKTELRQPGKPELVKFYAAVSTASRASLNASAMPVPPPT